jgi:hypothetical protein
VLFLRTLYCGANLPVMSGCVMMIYMQTAVVVMNVGNSDRIMKFIVTGK